MKHLILLVLSISIILQIVSCSNKGYYYKTKNFNKRVIFDSSFDYKDYRKEIEKKGELTIISKFDEENRLRAKTSYLIGKDTMKNGIDEEYDSTGTLSLKANYNKGEKHGEFLTYYSNGQCRRREEYADGKFIFGKCFDSTGKEIPFFKYDVEPYVDLINFQKCLVFPEELRRQNVEEDIKIRVYVDKRSKILAMEYDSNHSAQFINEITNCLFKTKIEAAKFDSVLVGCWVVVPFRFILRDKK